MKFKPLSLRAKLTTILFLSSCIIVLVTFILMATLYLSRVNSEINKRLIQGGSTVARQIDELQGKAQVQVQTVEDAPEVQALADQTGLCVGGAPSPKYAAEKASSDQELQQIASVANVDFIYVSNPAGQLVGSYPALQLACQDPTQKLAAKTELSIKNALAGDATGDKVLSKDARTSKPQFRVIASQPIQNDADHSTIGAVTAGYVLDGNALQSYVADTDAGHVQINDGISLYSLPTNLSSGSCKSAVIATTLFDGTSGPFTQPLNSCSALRQISSDDNPDYLIHNNFGGSDYQTSFTTLVDEEGDAIGAIAYSLNVDYAHAANLNILLLVGGIMLLVLVGVFVLIYFVVQNLTRMIGQLVDASKRVAAGDFTPRLAVVDDDEIGTLSRTFNIMTVQLSEYYGQLEGKVQERTEQLRAAQTKELQRAAEVNRLKDEFVYIAVHELRAPVTAIKGYMYLVLQKKIGKPSKELADLLVHVDDAGKHLSSLIDDLIEISRAEAGQTEIHLAPQNLTEILEKVVNEQRGSAEQKSLSLDYQPSQGLPYVLGDHDKLAEVFTNLISNSIKYTLKGAVTVSHELQDDRILTRVSDTGVGISREDQTHLFEKFFRAKNDQTANVVGTGLGLFIVKLLIEKMGGKIAVESELQKGTNVIVSLQMTHQRPAPVTQQSAGFKLSGLASSTNGGGAPAAPQPNSSPAVPPQATPDSTDGANPVRLKRPDFSLSRSSEPARRAGGVDGLQKPPAAETPKRSLEEQAREANAIQPPSPRGASAGSVNVAPQQQPPTEQPNQPTQPEPGQPGPPPENPNF
jgi:signal transduction histidine kinase